METEQPKKTNSRKPINGALITHLRAGVIVAMLVLGAGAAAGAISL